VKRFAILFSLLLGLAAIMGCEENAEKVIGSRDHDIKSARAQEPELLANGVASTHIIATVYNKDGSAASNMKVFFETTAGTIEEYGISDISGSVSAKLISVASDTDIVATVTATVADTTFSPLQKTSREAYTVSLSVVGFETQPSASLDKSLQQQDNRARLK